jgi:hypothetical protein
MNASTRSIDVQGTAENRRSPRKSASLVPSITGVRLSPVGGEAVLVNISATGILARCPTRVRPETAVNVLFEGGFSPAVVPSRIVYCVVAQIDGSGKLWFDLGIAFRQTIELGDAPAPFEAAAIVPPTDTAPSSSLAVNRW